MRTASSVPIPPLSIEARRALTAWSMREPVYCDGRRVHIVGCQTDVAALWFLLVDCPGQTRAFPYDPVEYGETSWEKVQEVASQARSFTPDEVVLKRRARNQRADSMHLLGIRTKRFGYMRFDRLVDDDTFTRLTYYNGLPERWTAWHQGHSYSWEHALRHPIITQGMWRRLCTGQEPEWEDSFLLPQDPLPLLEAFVSYAQVVRKLRVVPCTISEAKGYVRSFHRHNPAVAGGLFAVAVADLTGTIRGVAIVGRPIARLLDTGKQGERKRRVAEIVRLASDGTRDVCSMLYGAARRMAKEAGFERVITYTQQSETGASLRASGWTCVEETGGRQWDGKRPRAVNAVYEEAKYRWECDLNTPFPFEQMLFPARAEQATPFTCSDVF